MRRWLVLAVVLGVGACFGYERPKARRHDAIGAPGGAVDTNGLEVLRNDRANPEWTPSRGTWAPGREKFTEVARVRQLSSNLLTLERATGDSVQIRVVPLTRVTVNGKPAKPNAVRSGAEVRASYIVSDGAKVAERIEVLPTGP